MGKVKIILDADVLIHFSKANLLSLLPSILKEYDHVILSTVYEEVISIRQQIDNQIRFMKNMTVEQFNPTGQMRSEYAKLLSKYGKGESACMAYCRFTNNVIGSSNLKDIKEYCKAQKITFVTTLDFLYYAYKREKLTKAQCEDFIRDVTRQGSKLPYIDITTYSPNVSL